MRGRGGYCYRSTWLSPLPDDLPSLVVRLVAGVVRCAVARGACEIRGVGLMMWHA